MADQNKHSDIIPSINKKLTVLPNQIRMVNVIREALSIPPYFSDEQINYQLSWCKDKNYDVEQLKIHMKMQFCSDDSINKAIWENQNVSNPKT